MSGIGELYSRINSLEYEIDVSADIYEYTIPKITIQPLIENALYHGIKNKRGGGKITVSSGRDGEDIIKGSVKADERDGITDQTGSQ